MRPICQAFSPGGRVIPWNLHTPPGGHRFRQKCNAGVEPLGGVRGEGTLNCQQSGVGLTTVIYILKFMPSGSPYFVFVRRTLQDLVPSNHAGEVTGPKQRDGENLF